MLGWSKRTKWMTIGATGTACAVGLAMGGLALTAGATPVAAVATAPVTPLAPSGPTTQAGTPATLSKPVTKHVSKASALTSGPAATPGTQTYPTNSTATPPPSTAPTNTRSSYTYPPAPTPSNGSPPVTTRRVIAVTTTTTTPTTQPSVAPAAILQPSTAAVDQAIAGLAPYVKSPIKPSVSEVNTLGNEVCTAFSQGSTVSQIAAALTQQLGNIPFTKILPGASTYVMNTTVALYCPSYSSQLG